MTEYEGQNEERMCTLDESQRSQLISTFTDKKWQFIATPDSKSTTYVCPVKLTDIKKKSDSIYNVTLAGKDSVGASTFTGILMLQSDTLGIFLEKSYENKSKAKQTGNFSILLYKG